MRAAEDLSGVMFSCVSSEVLLRYPSIDVPAVILIRPVLCVGGCCVDVIGVEEGCVPGGGAAAGTGSETGTKLLTEICPRLSHRGYTELCDNEIHLASVKLSPHLCSRIASWNRSQSCCVDAGNRKYQRKALPASAVAAKAQIHFGSSCFPALKAWIRTALTKSSASPSLLPLKMRKSSADDLTKTSVFGLWKRIEHDKPTDIGH